MNKKYELNYALLDKEQVEQFSYNINIENINNYVMEHQEEYKVWQDVECLKEMIKQCLKNKVGANINERKKLLQYLRKEQLN